MSDLHKYSVLDVCKLLHMDARGTGPLLDEQRREYQHWLEWRLAHGWDDSEETETERIIREFAWKVLDDSARTPR